MKARKNVIRTFLRGGVIVLFTSALISSALLVVGSGAAEAENFNHLLRGDYAFSGEATCLVSLVSPNGFNLLNLTPVDSSAPFPFVFSFSVQGVRTFDGKGNGTLAARVVSIKHPFALPTSPPVFNRGGASSSDVEAHFTYEVAPDLTFTVETTMINGTVLKGTSPGNADTFTITNFPQFSGRISQDHRTLTLAHDVPTVETIKFFKANLQVAQEDRICHRSRILLELKGGK